MEFAIVGDQTITREQYWQYRDEDRSIVVPYDVTDLEGGDLDDNDLAEITSSYHRSLGSAWDDAESA